MFPITIYCIVPNPQLPIAEVTVCSYNSIGCGLALKMVLSMIEISSGFQGKLTVDNPHFFNSPNTPKADFKMYVSFYFPSFKLLDDFKKYLTDNGPFGFTSD